MPFSNGQDITDAVRYSTDDIKGTARFRSMSGAFGALGGDLSAVSVNPAGSAIFNRSHASISLSNFNFDNEVDYFGSMTSNSDSNFELNQGGVAFVFESTDDSPWRKIVISLIYDQTQNLDQSFFATGTNTTSIDSYFLAYAQGLRLDEISAFEGESITDAYGDIGAIFGYGHQQAFLGFESFILEPEDINDDANTVYFSNIAPGTFNQEFSYASTGYNGKFGVNAAIQHKDNLYLGVNLNSHFLNYTKSTFLFEENSNLDSFVTEVGFENNLAVEGRGFSFQLGLISQLTDMVRVGLSYDSPVWYDISEETTQYLATTQTANGANATTVLDPRIVNIFPDYKLQTPSKLTGSIALILNKQGLISFDYARKDYSKMKFRPESDTFFAAQNNLISNALGVSNIYRIGGELRHNEFSFRGGYRFEESPYEDTNFYGDLTGYSLGLGYSFGNTRLDLAYENSNREINHQLYNIGLTDAARVDTNNTDITLSLSFTL